MGLERALAEASSMTQAELEAIYDFVRKPGNPARKIYDSVPITCDLPNTEEDLFDETLRGHGFVSYAGLDDYNHRTMYERSLWLRRPDDTCYPELLVLATLKHGKPLDWRAEHPYWTDRDFRNRTMQNITIPTIAPPVERPSSRYGVRAGTEAYKKAHYTDPRNLEARRAASRRYAKKHRELLQAAQLEIREGETPKAAQMRMAEEETRKMLGWPPPDERKGDDDDRTFGQSTPLDDYAASPELEPEQLEVPDVPAPTSSEPEEK